MAEVDADAPVGLALPRRRRTDIDAPGRAFLCWASFIVCFVGIIVMGLLLLWQGPKAEAALLAAAASPPAATAPAITPPPGFDFAKAVAGGIALLVKDHSEASSLLGRPTLQPGLWLIAPMLIFMGFLMLAALLGLEWPVHSFYYLGFLFTLASLFSAFGQFVPSANVPTPPMTNRVQELLGMAGSALSTTFIGLILRYIAQPIQHALVYWDRIQRIRTHIWECIRTKLKALLRSAHLFFPWLGKQLRSQHRNPAAPGPEEPPPTALPPDDDGPQPRQPGPGGPYPLLPGPTSNADNQDADLHVLKHRLTEDGLQHRARKVIENFAKAWRPS